MEETQSLSVLSPEMQESFRKELVTMIADTLSELNQKSGNSREWLSKKEACQYLSCSNGTLDKYINEYELKVVVIEGIRRFKKSDLDEFYLKYQI
ncbi:helix-turn-helix domain-containing protein [Desemzia incerta]|uniref:helix-turn-helix domain-containing protein n=1 Tax=Desemzia incerta TaxID=82801 RepID=UPI003D04C80D